MPPTRRPDQSAHQPIPIIPIFHIYSHTISQRLPEPSAQITHSIRVRASCECKKTVVHGTALWELTAIAYLERQRKEERQRGVPSDPQPPPATACSRPPARARLISRETVCMYIYVYTPSCCC